jgi:5-methyltetrahydrofolate--homocysteine methyltransferase
MEILNELAEELQKGNSDTVQGLIKQALSQDIPAEKILYQGLVEGMQTVSEKFKNNEIFIPEVLISAKAMNQGLEILTPHLADADIPSQGKVVIGTVRGDLHDIGKNIVAMLLQGAGFEIFDLGADVPKERFLETAKNERADIIGISALLTTTMVYMKEVIDTIKDARLEHPIKFMIGGAPVTDAYAQRIGADGYAADAASAVDLAKKLLK